MNDGLPSSAPLNASTAIALLDGSTVSTALTNGVATAAASLAVAYAAATWQLTLVKAATNRIQRTIHASLDAAGTAVNWSETGPDDAGVWTGTIACDVDSGNMRLLITAPSTGWTAYATRLYHDAS